ncbi:MAG: DUF6515 family protein [Pseudomonadota bacterium]
MRPYASIVFLSLIVATGSAIAQPPPPPGGVPIPPPPGEHRKRIYNSGDNGRHSQFLARLPSGHKRISHDGAVYYSHRGQFYVEEGDGYVTTTPPQGIKVKKLPRGAKQVGRASDRIYEHKGVHYQKIGHVYEVVDAR